MSPQSPNPYDDYDLLDPHEILDDEDEATSGAGFGGGAAFVQDELQQTGLFEYVEDEYEPQETSSAFAEVRPGSTSRREVSQNQGAQPAIARTQVRPAVGTPLRTEAAPVPQGPVLKRRKKRTTRKQKPAHPAYPVAASVPSPEAPARIGSMRRPRRRRRRRHGCLFSLLMVLCVVTAGLYWLVAGPIDERLAFDAAEQRTLDGTLSWSLPGTPYYVLALGSDAREGDSASRTDTMVLMRVDLLGGKLTMVSIPRDTMVQIDGYGTSKINAAYAYGGAGGAVRVVSQLLDVPVSHVAVIHFDELVGLVDYLGGVTVNVPVDVYDPEHSGLVLSAGMQTLDGATALAWARTRYGFENGDFQRQEDQRILITAIMNRVISLSPREMPGALKMMGDLVGTDLRCYNLVPLFVRFKLASPTVYSCTLPTTSQMQDGYWYEILNKDEAATLMKTVSAGGDPATLGY